jgi:hypothetical protein
MRIEKAGVIQSFDNRRSLNNFLSEMEKELNYLNPELARTLTRNQVKKMIRKIGQE